MTEYRLGPMESRFAGLIWDNEPLSSGELARLCRQELSWKKSTTYTILRRLCERGLFCNEEGTVTSRISRQDFIARQSQEFVRDSFNGSLPAFVAAFTASTPLSEAEAAEIRRLIDGFEEG